MRTASILRAIERDRTSGARELAEKAAEAVLAFLEEHKDLPPKALLERLERLSLRLLRAQPAMAPLINFTDRLWFQAEREEARLPAALMEEARGFSAGMAQAAERIASKAVELMRGAGVVLTYSFSSTVLKALAVAKQEGRAFQVLCSEGRPAGEGLKTASALAALRVPVTLTSDAALPGFVRTADLVLVGADAVLFSGFANKVGTYPLALAAKEAGVPFYALCDSGKFLPRSLEPLFRILEKNPEEIWKAPPPGVQVINRSFEIIPYSLLVGLVSEEGILPPREVIRRLKGRKVSKRLLHLAQALEGSGDLMGKGLESLVFRLGGHHALRNEP